MRSIALALALTAAAAPLAAQEHGGHHGGQHQHHGQHGEHHAGAAPAGWQVRADRAGADLAQMHFMDVDGVIHVRTGPAVIVWNPENAATGEYRVQASFEQMHKPTHPEAYGLLLGGRDLDGPAQDYLYFIVRGDGKYMVKHRAGDEVHEIVPWTEHPAIAREDAQGRATNVLAAEAGAFGVRLLANGTQVAEFLKKDVPYLNTDGIAGMRVNHNLDVHVTGFAVERR